MLNQQPQGKYDVETRAMSLHPTVLESPEIQWSFIRKVYAIITMQLLVNIAVGVVFATVPPIYTFTSAKTLASTALFIVILFLPIIPLWQLSYYHQKQPVNYILLGIFMIFFSFVIGFYCNPTTNKILSEAAILIAVVVIALILYTFWAARRGQDYGFFGPSLFGSVPVLLVFALIQVFYPLSELFVAIVVCLGAITFCLTLVEFTDNLIKRFLYDQYIWDSVSLYLAIIGLFFPLFAIFTIAVVMAEAVVIAEADSNSSNQ